LLRPAGFFAGVLGLALLAWGLGGIGLFQEARAVVIAVLLAMVSWTAWNARRLSQVDAQRRRAVAERRRSEDRFRTIFEQAPMGIGLLDSRTGRILEVNAKYSEILDQPREELASLDWMRITHPDDVQPDLDQMGRLLAGEISAFQLDKRLMRTDGSVIWVRLTVVPIQVETAATPHHLAMIEDITARKRAEEERQRLHGQILQAQKMESLGCLAGGVAHDMNNVLGAILGLASASVEEMAPDSLDRQAMATIIKAAERGGKVVKGLLSFARETPAEVRELNLNEILQEQARLLAHTTLSKVHLVLDLANDLRPIQGDTGSLTHALMNLCVNALDAMPDGGTLALRSRNTGPASVEVQVEDTGAGMSPEVLARAMDPFFTTKGMGKGTGLGLAMAYRTVKAHHGQMELRSQPGQGTCVTLEFPATEPVVRAPAAPEAAPPAAGPGGLQVLVVDDDELIQRSVGMLLDVLGHAPVIAVSGEQALQKIQAGLRPDLVILDMNMPGLGGKGTLPRLRALFPHLPVLLATGRVDQTALDLVESDPNTFLLAKPFSMQDLRVKIAAVARSGGRPVAGPPLPLG
jgi:PAS domain S-box-containing protein